MDWIFGLIDRIADKFEEWLDKFDQLMCDDSEE